MCVCDFRIVSCPRAQAAAEIPPFLRELLWECKTAKTGTPKDTRICWKIVNLKKGKVQKNTYLSLTVTHTRIRAQFIPRDKITNKARHLFSLFYIAHIHTHTQSTSISCLYAVGRYLPWSPDWHAFDLQKGRVVPDWHTSSWISAGLVMPREPSHSDPHTNLKRKMSITKVFFWKPFRCLNWLNPSHTCMH